MRSMQWMVFVAAVGLLCLPAVAQDQLFIDFESPTYMTGDVVGQDDWVLIFGGGGTAAIIAGDNGPGGAGSQCLELGDAAGDIQIEKMFADLVGPLPKLVTYEIDLRVVAGSDLYYCRPYIPGGLCGYWHTNWAQWTGAYNPDGTDWQYSHGTTGWDQYVWHTHTWRMIYSAHDSGKGQLLSYQLDDDPPETRYAAQQCYIRDDQSSILNLINVEFYNHGDTDPDFVRLDNILITVEELPGEIPVADAGPDVTQDPGSWDGVQLDGSGSSDVDGDIVRYRWMSGDRHDVLVYDGSEATPTVDLDAGIHLLMLEVFDDTGLRDTDFATYTIGARPLIDDEVAGPWGIRNADIYGTGASDEITIDTSAGEFEVVTQVFVPDPWDGLPCEGNSNFVFDRFGKFYYVSWGDFLECWSKNLERVWRGSQDNVDVKLGDHSINHPSVIAGIRYIYTVGTGKEDDSWVPRVYAFQKSTGELAWSTLLVGEDWFDQQCQAKMTLYNDKLYVLGENISPDDSVNIFQLNATSGEIDWTSNVLVEMQYPYPGVDRNAGSLAFVPDAYGEGLHGLFWNQMSDMADWASFDGYGDMVGVQIDPASGATTMWGPAENVDGPGLDKSHPIYSATTGRVYTPSYYGVDGHGWPSSFYAWTPAAGFFGAYSEEDGGNHGFRDTFALDFDGTTVHATSSFDSIYSYTDEGGGSFSVEYRDYGGYTVNGWGFAVQGGLLQDQNGHSILITATEPYDDGEIFVPPKVVALDLSEPADPNGNTPIAEWVAGAWDDELETWDWNMPYLGPAPGPDGSIYFIQNDDDWFGGQSRITRLRFVPPSGCDGDVDGDGDTDHSDLGALLAAWGSQPGDPNWNPGADLDGSGEVGHSDLGILLGDWGCGVP